MMRVVCQLEIEGWNALTSLGAPLPRSEELVESPAAVRLAGLHHVVRGEDGDTRGEGLDDGERGRGHALARFERRSLRAERRDGESDFGSRSVARNTTFRPSTGPRHLGFCFRRVLAGWNL